jgi:zinc/manganese transport system permease protein
VLRRSSFAAHALSHVGFAGAASAVLFGIDPIIGLLLFTSGGGITMALLGRRAANRDVHIGTVLAFMLGLGVLFISLYKGYATAAYSILFGEILGISNTDVLVTLAASIIILFLSQSRIDRYYSHHLTKTWQKQKACQCLNWA